MFLKDMIWNNIVARIIYKLYSLRKSKRKCGNTEENTPIKILAEQK
jgi:hypothetical protein